MGERHRKITEIPGAIRDESSETKMNLISSILPKNMDFDNNNKVCNMNKF